MAFKCLSCPRSFTTKSHLTRHVKSVHGRRAEVFNCTRCTKTYNRRDNYNHHVRTCNGEVRDPATSSSSSRSIPPVTINTTAPKRKREKGRSMKMIKNVGRTVSLFRSSFKKTRQHYNTIEKLSDAINLDVRSTIQKHLRTQHKKWYIALKVIFSKAVDPSITTIPSIVFTSHPVHTASATSLDTALATAKQELIDKIDQFVAGGSGWVIDSLEEIYLVLSTYDPLRGSSYIELPKKFRNAKKWLLNIRNNVQKCFLWCVLAHLYPITERHQS